MWLRKILGLVPGRKKALENAFDPVVQARKSGVPGVFREFAPAPRRQAGGSFRSGLRHASGVDRNVIVPSMGVKVP